MEWGGRTAAMLFKSVPMLKVKVLQEGLGVGKSVGGDKKETRVDRLGRDPPSMWARSHQESLDPDFT